MGDTGFGRGVGKNNRQGYLKASGLLGKPGLEPTAFILKVSPPEGELENDERLITGPQVTHTACFLFSSSLPSFPFSFSLSYHTHSCFLQIFSKIEMTIWRKEAIPLY